ncbi:MAG: hypothetical protein HYV47_00110 [Candidatus Nealsonbacteria bacterium]|nr:hypothetical protein [Candidatus Nealsonbacteria bacterium]
MRKNVFSAENQQGSPAKRDPSETTRQAPLSKKEIKAYLLGALHDETFSSNTGKIYNPSRKIDPDYWRMFILAHSQEKFVTIIGSWHPRKIKTLKKRMKI